MTTPALKSCASALLVAGLLAGSAAGAAESNSSIAALLGKAEADNAEAQYLLGVLELKTRRQPAAAARWLERAAAKGHDGAGAMLATLLLWGAPGVAADPGRAVAMLRAAADAGRPEAQLALGEAVLAGRDGPADPAAAARLFAAAALQGNPGARFNLGMLALRGRGVPQDSRAAAEWLRQAAEAGHAGAQYNLALLCLMGEGVPPDQAAAVKWLTLAAARGDADIRGRAEARLRQLAPQRQGARG